MSQNNLSRRRLLTYLGLGATATGAAVIAERSRSMSLPNRVQPTDSQPSSQPDSQSVAVATTTQNMLPEFAGIAQWLNSQPLSVTNLKGKATLIQFWTYTCINCQRTLPYIVRWHRDYASQGLQVIGIHTPEFSYERQADNVKQALQKHGITYPVPLDNDYKTWTAYQNQYWPHLFLADHQGVIRYDHIGEGAYDQTEQKIRQLLA